MKKLYYLSLLLLLSFVACDKSTTYKYEEVPNDPLKVRIYTLDNGLKVYLSVNKDAPRIQTYIGVKAGGKNDPKETTGLAHYFEHLMFKGTTHFGTSNYEAEKPELDKIEELFEVYRTVDDPAERTKIYSQIDSISQVASTYAIPNEYDKLMAQIGAQGTNAFTSYDVTAYVENIPSNEINNWINIQLERFQNPVLRLFHTELETVYEEYNMSLTKDMRKVFEKEMQLLYPNHPYGTQTVLGTQENLKNPSITNIKNFYDQYYVPNNMCIVMAGDFNPDEVIATIDKTFGQWKSKEVPKFTFTPETPIEKPITAEVVGLEAENIFIGYRMPEASSKDVATMDIVSSLLYNGKAGLMDLNLNQQQKVLGAYAGDQVFADYSMMMLYGFPKTGQTLDEVKDLLLQQIELLKKGEFDDNLLQAIINNAKLDQYYKEQSIDYIASTLLFSFINNTPWKDEVDMINYQSSLTKKDIMDFCNKYFKDNYVAVYKKQGTPDNPKIDKPQITPIKPNRDMESDYLKQIKESKVQPIEPMFVDYDKDMSKLKTNKNIEVLYKQNTLNPTFSMNYVYEMGDDNDKLLGTAFSYLEYLGTSKQTAADIQKELYQLACSFSVNSTPERVYVSISGLNDNFEKAMTLLESKLTDAVVDIEAYKNVALDIIKAREMSKANQQANFQMLGSYAKWGAKSSATNISTAEELQALNPQVLVDKIKDLKNYEHKILYFGPKSSDEIVKIIETNHLVAESLKPVPEAVKFQEQSTDKPTVYLANYDATQIYMGLLHKGIPYQQEIIPVVSLYNNYFGGGMSSIVFQEMREARALAYSAWVGYSQPNKPTGHFYLGGYIASQNDKLKDAIVAFDEIINDMPLSQQAFDRSKEEMITNLRTRRVLRESVLWNYLSSQKFGYKEDPSKIMYNALPSLTLDSVSNFQKEYVKDKSLVYYILGDVKNLDQNYLKTLGDVKILKQEEIFGY